MGKGKNIAYVRVSNFEQNEARQGGALYICGNLRCYVLDIDTRKRL